MAEKKKLREELADLRAEVEQLRASQSAHHCHGSCCAHAHAHCNWGHCWCFTVHGSYQTYLPQVWCGTVTSGTSTAPDTSEGSGSLPGSITQSAAGYPVEGFAVTNGVVTSSGYTVSASN